MNRLRQILLAAWLALPGALLADDIRTALVIGSNQYPISPLVNSVKDARAMAEKLQRLGFSVELLLDADSQRLRQAVNDFAAKVSRQPRTVAVLYFSGHGVQIQDRNILLGTDVGHDTIEEHSIDIQRFLNSIKPGRDASYLVILDACREYKPQKDRRGLSAIDAPAGTLIALSTAPGRLASDGDPRDGNGLYTKYLLRNLQTPGQQIESVFKKVRQEVIQESRGAQIPWENSSLLRDLYLVSGDAPAAASPPAPAAKPGKAAAPVPAAPPETGSQHRLSEFYRALATIRSQPGISETDRQTVNDVFARAYGLSLSDGELRFIAPYALTLGFHALELPAFIRERYQLGAGQGVLVWQSDGSGLAERLGLLDGDVLTELNGKRLRAGEDFRDLLALDKLVPGQKLSVALLRHGQPMRLETILERTSPASLLMKLAYEKHRTRDMVRAKALLEGLATQEDPRALGGLARAYFYEEPEFGGAQFEKAFQLAGRAAALGDLHGESIHALALDMGRGTPEDKPKAMAELRQAADKGRNWAFGILARRLMNGDGLEKNPALALEYAQRGAYLGDLNSTYILARLYAKGIGVDKHVPTALQWYQRTTELIHLTRDTSEASRKFLKLIESESKMLQSFGWTM